MIFGIVSAMTPDNADDLEPTIFSATITPHRSLGRVGFLVLMLVFGGVSFRRRHALSADGRLAGVRLFRARRAAAVLGVPAQLLARARLRGGHGDASALTVRKVSHRGRVREWVLNPLWVQLDKVERRNSASTGCSWCRAASN